MKITDVKHGFSLSMCGVWSKCGFYGDGCVLWNDVVLPPTVTSFSENRKSKKKIEIKNYIIKFLEVVQIGFVLSSTDMQIPECENCTPKIIWFISFVSFTS